MSLSERLDVSNVDSRRGSLPSEMKALANMTGRRRALTVGDAFVPEKCAISWCPKT
jgi:hypothetical protein